MTDHPMRHDPVPPADDEPLEPWLQTLVRDYNAPPATPRDQMWARIQAARGRPDAAAPTAAAPAVLTVDELAARRQGGGGQRWIRPLLALAATLLLGVALGRWSSQRPGAAPSTVAVQPAAPGTPAAPVLDPAVVAAPGSVATVAADVGASAPASSDRSPAPTSRDVAVAPVVVAQAAPAADTPPTPTRDLATPYRVATVQHLGQVEALLTAFRAAPTSRTDSVPSLEPWARDLLGTTRLLLDSPAAGDARLGALLGELETVLVQIVQLPAARAAEERQLIAQTLDESDLLTQLRSAVPAGPAAPQRSGE